MAHWVKIRKTLYTKKSTFYWKFLGTKWPVSNWTQLRNEDTNIFKMFIFCTIFLFFLPIIVYDGDVYMCSKINTKEYICSIQSIQFSRIDDQKNMQKCKMHSPIFEKSWDSLSKTESDLKKNHTQVIGHTSYFFSPCDATGTQNWIFMCTV